jgi:hypothetical protein
VTSPKALTLKMATAVFSETLENGIRIATFEIIIVSFFSD